MNLVLEIWKNAFFNIHMVYNIDYRTEAVRF